jgi:hypothetical protein
MPLISRIVAQVALVLLFTSCANQSVGAEVSGPRLDGAWSGAIAIEDDPSNLLQVRITIAEDAPQVEVLYDGKFVTALQNPFQISRHQGNAVLYATHSGTDDDGTWVESWAFLVTPRTSNELIVVWSRLVNNVDMPVDKESSKFTVTGSGVLRRIPADG